jgi:hypothetical protein
MTIPSPWVWRHDGTIQCEDRVGETLAEARAQLETIIGAENVLDEEKRTVPMPRMCGLPTGEVNAFQLTPWGFWLLYHGIVGPIGFQPWLDRGGDEARLEGEVPFPFQELAGSAGEQRIRAVSSMAGGGPGSDPVLIAQLYGRPCRCYRLGDALTQDFVPERVNIGLGRGQRIAEIWFG